MNADDPRIDLTSEAAKAEALLSVNLPACQVVVDGPQVTFGFRLSLTLCGRVRPFWTTVFLWGAVQCSDCLQARRDLGEL